MEEMDFEKLKGLLESRNYRGLASALADENEIDIAEFLEEVPEDQLVLVFRLLPKEMAAEVFSNLPSDVQGNIINGIADKELTAIIEDLKTDDAVDMLEELPANVVRRVMKVAKSDTRKELNEFLSYPENSVGSIMTSEFIDMKKGLTVSEAIEYIRANAEESEMIYTCYVTGIQHQLIGVVTIRDLILADKAAKIEDIMETDVISVKTSDDREEASQTLMHYDLLSLPVVDKENRLVGIVTVDDVMDVMEEEATEDFQKMAAMTPSDKPYLKTSPLLLAKNRLTWLLVLMVSSMISGLILGKFQNAFAQLPLLVTFIPTLMDTGGNAGSQSATMIIRGMAVGEIEPKDILKVVFKEIRVAALVGFALAVINFIRLIIQYPGMNGIAAVVSVSLMITVIIAKTLGGILPIFAKVLHVDPALMASPMITTIVDALSLIIYFTIATKAFGLA